MTGIRGIDHIVLTVCDIERSLQFYTGVLGMEKILFGDQRVALQCGDQKINLHQPGTDTHPKAAHPTVGSSDLCLLVDRPLTELRRTLQKQDVEIIEGPVERSGAKGKLHSLYIRDPDGNLIELSNLH